MYTKNHVPLLLEHLQEVRQDDAPGIQHFQCMPSDTSGDTDHDLNGSWPVVRRECNLNNTNIVSTATVAPSDGLTAAMPNAVPSDGTAKPEGSEHGEAVPQSTTGELQRQTPVQDQDAFDVGDPDAPIDDPDIETDEAAGAQGRDLRAEATSLKHLWSHSKVNRHCPACREAIANNRAKKRGAVTELRSKLTKFGQNICGDVADMRRDGWDRGHDGSNNAFVLHDMYSTYTDCYGQKTKQAPDHYHSMNDFAYNLWVDCFYSDRAPDLIQAAKWLGWNHPKAQASMPRTNPTAELNIHRVCRGVRKLLAMACLPNCFWPYTQVLLFCN